MCFKFICTTVLLFTMISSVSATGHIRLVITPSNDLALRLVTNILHAESYWMSMGVEKTTSFHPLIEQESLPISFSVDGLTPQIHVYEFNNAGKVKRDVLVFDQMVILVEATFECDAGFTGSRCQRSIIRVARPRVFTSPATIPTTKTQTTTTATTNIPTTTPTISIPSPSALLLQGNSNILIILAVAIIILAFLIIIFVICTITKRRSSIYIGPADIGSTEIKKINESLESGLSNQSSRYTKEPNKIFVLMTPC